MINSFCRCADVSPLIYENGDNLTVNDINAEEKRLWLLLCSIGDPHNLGAIIRYNLSRLNNNCFNDNHLSYFIDLHIFSEWRKCLLALRMTVIKVQLRCHPLQADLQVEL